MIIAINGRVGSGKDTVGSMIQELTAPDRSMNKPYDPEKPFEGKEMPSNWQIKKFAGKLKTIASLLTGIPVEKFEDQEFKKTYLPEQWNAWVIEWKHGDDGPGKAFFDTEEEAKNFMEECFEDGYDPTMVKFTRITVEGVPTETWY